MSRHPMDLLPDLVSEFRTHKLILLQTSQGEHTRLVVLG